MTGSISGQPPLPMSWLEMVLPAKVGSGEGKAHLCSEKRVALWGRQLSLGKQQEEMSFVL